MYGSECQECIRKGVGAVRMILCKRERDYVGLERVFPLGRTRQSCFFTYR
jgi:hypothetical protein